MFLGIMVVAVLLGYLTARYVVGPLIGYDADESPARAAGEPKEDAGEEKSDSSGEDAGTEASSASVPDDGYALQFGAFSTEDAARNLAADLKKSGIETDIIKTDGVYKVISPLLDTKEKALEALSDLPETAAEDVFIASFS